MRNKGSLLHAAEILYEFNKTHSLNKTLFVVYYMPSSVLGTGDANDLDFQELWSVGGDRHVRIEPGSCKAPSVL